MLVTGGNRGIGLAIAPAFAAQGDRVAVTHRSPVVELPDGLLAVPCDVTDTAAVDAAFAKVEAEQGPVQVLVSNAGITDDGLLMRMSEESFTRVIDANLTAAYRVAKRASRGMLKARAGRMIFVSSVVGLTGSAGQVNYAASKAGLVGLARSVARELGSRGITANVVAPGFVDTDMTRALPDARRAEILGQVPLAATPPSEEVAAAVTWLGSDAAALRHGCDHPGRRRPRHGSLTGGEDRMGLLDGKRLLVTGVITDASLAFHAARIAQEQGAQVVLTGFGRMRLVERIAQRLPQAAPVVELDVSDQGQLDSLVDRLGEHLGPNPASTACCTRSASRRRAAWARAPSSPRRGRTWRRRSRVSAYSLKSLAMATLPLLGPGASIVGMDFDNRQAWPAYDWMGVAKSTLESVTRYLARDLGPKGIRVNLVAAGPVRTMAAKSIPGFSAFEDAWDGRAPLGWNVDDPVPVAKTVCALLSDWLPVTTGSMVWADGGFHAIGVVERSALGGAGPERADRGRC